MNTGDRIRKKYRIEKIKATRNLWNHWHNQSTYSKIENNKYKLDIETLKKIAGVLEVDLIKLIDVDKTEINHTIMNFRLVLALLLPTLIVKKLITLMENHIDLLKEQNQLFKETTSI
jgi:transcriptional regulator with XRE-family HTH domain